MKWRHCEHQSLDRNSNMFKCNNPDSNNTHCVYSEPKTCSVSIPKLQAYISFEDEYARWTSELNDLCDSGELDNMPMGLKSLLYQWIEWMRFTDKYIHEMRKTFNSHRHISYDELGEQATSEPLEEDE